MNQIKTMIKIVILMLLCSSGTLLHLARSYFSNLSIYSNYICQE